MRSTSLVVAVVAGVCMVGTGCATKRYVVKTVNTSIEPVDKRVTGTESKNGDQDKELATHTGQIQELDRDLSRTKERLGDVDNKAVAAGQSATRAGERAEGAMTAANGAMNAANGARSYAETGLNKLEHTMDAMNKFQLLKAETVLFPVNSSKLPKDAIEPLTSLAKMIEGHERYVIEIQGFTDKTGPASYNESLSQHRAEEVARYLVNEQKIPVRSVQTLGSGYATPVADDKTREGRKLNRRVEVRLYVPQADSAGGQLAAQKND